LDTDVWRQFVEAIEEVMTQAGVDDSKRQLQLMRSPVNTGHAAFTQALEDGKLVRMEDVEVLEKHSSIQLSRMLGFTFDSSDIFAAENYLRMAQNLAAYYAETKGTEGWQAFLGFCLDAEFRVRNMWTRDYITFIEEGEPGIGFHVNEGGTWYPTTHISIEYDPSKFTSLSTVTVYNFFNWFANINLVLESISLNLGGGINLQVAMAGYLEIEL
jgi:hypothetical protein